MTLLLQDFDAFFSEVHGVAPFPWQRILLQRVVQTGTWPATLDLPTGAGKTAAIDIAVFHLALEASNASRRLAPLRIAFVVDRRLVVDDAYARARQIASSLLSADPTSTSGRVAAALRRLAVDGPPLVVRRLRGGIPREDDWARTPSQPTILCSTVDQVGSRLLFRGYGVSDSMKPVHAGLLGSDCLILLDEAHLAEPFRQTLEWVKRYRGERWRASHEAAPFGVALLTATPGVREEGTFALDTDPRDRDTDHPVLRPRLQAHKPVRLLKMDTEPDRRLCFDEEVRTAIAGGARAVAVVVNRVARARSLFESLRSSSAWEWADFLLLIGPARPADRDGLAAALAPIRTGGDRALPRPLVVVATQTIEAGVDLDFDALFTEIAPLDALRQRFGRLNRGGRPMAARGAIVATSEDLAARTADPVYGEAAKEAWKALREAGTASGKKDVTIDFGLAQFHLPMPPETLSPRPDAPVLLPAHLDLLSQTSPIPVADPDIGLHLHGADLQPDAVTLVWRGDVQDEMPGDDLFRLLMLVPPRIGEAIQLPVWAVKHWLTARALSDDALADVATGEPNLQEAPDAGLRVFRWSGLEDRSGWIAAGQVRAGDTIVVPASRGGVDVFGWHPISDVPASDVADAAAAAHRSRRFAVRIAPGVAGERVDAARLTEVLGAHRHAGWRELCDALRKLPLDSTAADMLVLLERARGRRGAPAVEIHFDAYGNDHNGHPRGVVFVAPRGLKGFEASSQDGAMPGSTEDDFGGSLAGFSQSLREHSAQVEAKAMEFARACELSAERANDLALAGFLHDEGKRDPRFQQWLHHGDPFGVDTGNEETVLAKSGRPLPPSSRDKAGLPPHWRHEALSVRLVRTHEKLREASDPDLVLWLIGTHHGHGRPLFPHADPLESVPDVGPQSLAFDWNGMDWPMLFQRLRARYGTWELARMEAILRLADHRASEEAARGEEDEA